MADKRITRLPPQERRAQLVAIGLEMLTDRSLDELSTDEVARRADISRGLLFHYFPSKRAFHQAVVRAECERLLAASAPVEPAGRPLDAGEWLRACVAGFVGYVREHRRLYLALVRGGPANNPSVQEIVDETRERLAGRVLEYHRRAGLAPREHLRVIARAWIAYAEEAVVGWPLEEPGAREELSGFLEDSLVHLLGTGPRAPDALEDRPRSAR